MMNMFSPTATIRAAPRRTSQRLQKLLTAARIAVCLLIFGVLVPNSAAAAIIPSVAAQDANPFWKSATLEPRATAIKIMVVGDSMSQGREGDWTWRYRLWEWFNSQNLAVDFVGPYTGTVPPDPPLPPAEPAVDGEVAASTPLLTNGGYAVGVLSNFDSNHFAIWGRSAAQDKDLIRDEVQTYSPDYLLVMIGFNDLGWAISDAAGTLDSISSLVNEARVAKPDIKIALANVPQRSALSGREDLPISINNYNSLLKTAIPSWSTTSSPIKLVELRENYSCDVDGCPVGYDGLHPTALGEYQIAQAFSKTLVSGFQFGTSALTIPASVPDRPTPIPSNFQAVSSAIGVTVTWDAVYGAIGYDVQVRTAGATTWNLYSITSNRWDTNDATDGQTMEYQVRTSSGNTLKSAWTATSSAVSRPERPPPPVHIISAATSTGIDVSWTSPGDTSINIYQVITLDEDTSGAWLQGKAVRTLSTHIDGLISGHRYLVGLQSFNPNGGGTIFLGRDVIVGVGTPPAPTNLQITSTDSTTVQIAWCGSAQAVGYRIWLRNINDATSVSSTPNEYTSATSTSTGVGFLFPGVWNYEFCITAVNGAAESAKSVCVVAPQPGAAAVGGPVGGSGCFTN